MVFGYAANVGDCPWRMFNLPPMNPKRLLLREKLIPICIVAMWAGMLWARALLSIAMGAFVIAALLYSGPTKAWESLRKDRGAWALVLLFLIPLAGFPWSADKQAWWEAMLLKAPFLALPFTLATMREVSVPSLRRTGLALVVLTLLSALLTVMGYLAHPAEVNGSYLRGAVMQVPMDNDHVRYGWALSLIYLVLLLDVAGVGGGMTGLRRNTALLILFLTGAFILLLSSRTGILGFLLANMMVGIMVGGRKPRIGLAAALVLAPLLAYVLFPSLRHRVRFMVWDFQHYSRGNYREGLNDAPRVISWRAAVELIPERPWTGTGFGGIRPRMQEWYAAKRPDMAAYERLVPSNEWLFHGVASGIPGMLLFTLAIALAYRSGSASRLWRIAWWVAVAGFLYETGLEVQHGVFLFAFFMVWSVAWEGRERTE